MNYLSHLLILGIKFIDTLANTAAYALRVNVHVFAQQEIKTISRGNARRTMAIFTRAYANRRHRCRRVRESQLFHKQTYQQQRQSRDINIRVYRQSSMNKRIKIERCIKPAVLLILRATASLPQRIGSDQSLAYYTAEI